MKQTELSFEQKVALENKKAWRIGELAAYSGIAESYLYKLHMKRLIPGAYKPVGKIVFFDSQKVIAWMLSNPLKTHEEIDQEAATYVALNP
ncbi:DNA-binding protein [Cytophagaceae bacterium DM2B3-1]|uniref:DNA-binding protein n=1 Tax=Xanthocytophaga flava TaxID=3048013 RepID=A0ABT7CS22_9BACT|nr:hypothetical protein [Xanthocytophaga flavus]MDJ1496549.1 DNA-binding protein [Xanthocytophaga flavus]